MCRLCSVSTTHIVSVPFVISVVSMAQWKFCIIQSFVHSIFPLTRFNSHLISPYKQKVPALWHRYLYKKRKRDYH